MGLGGGWAFGLEVSLGEVSMAVRANLLLDRLPRVKKKILLDQPRDGVMIFMA